MYHSGRNPELVLWQGAGVSYRPFRLPRSGGGGGRRGTIEGFSAASARRLRYLLLMYEAPGLCYSCTCTLRGDPRTPSLWRSRIDAFGKRLVRLGGAFVWRVELQRRQMPHLHIVAWLPTGVNPDSIRDAWLGVWGLSDDVDHIRHAVHTIPMTDEAWLAYVASHSIKHKADQLGWIGRQWGVWGRSRLRPRPHLRLAISVPFDDFLRRYLRVLSWLHGRPYDYGSLSTWMRYCDCDFFSRLYDRAYYRYYLRLVDTLPDLWY